MSKEFPVWMERTSVAVDEKFNGRPRIKSERVSEATKKQLIKSILDESLYHWDYLKVDRALEAVSKAFDLKVSDKWVAAALNETVRIEPRDTVYQRIIEQQFYKEDVRLIRYLGIETRADNGDVEGFTRFNFCLRTDSIFIGSTQPDPGRDDRNYLTGVNQDLGNPRSIKSAEIFRDRLDGYFENLVKNYQTFYPKKV